MSINDCHRVAAGWTDEILRQQLDFVLEEYSMTPRAARNDMNPSFGRVLDWYRAVTDEYCRRGKGDELNAIVKDWREKRKACQS